MNKIDRCDGGMATIRSMRGKYAKGGKVGDLSKVANIIKGNEGRGRKGALYFGEPGKMKGTRPKSKFLQMSKAEQTKYLEDEEKRFAPTPEQKAKFKLERRKKILRPGETLEQLEAELEKEKKGFAEHPEEFSQLDQDHFDPDFAEGGRVRYAEGGRVSALKAIKDAIAHLDNGDTVSALRTLHSSPGALSDPNIAAAVAKLRRPTTARAGRQVLDSAVEADTNMRTLPTFARGGKVKYVDRFVKKAKRLTQGDPK